MIIERAWHITNLRNTRYFQRGRYQRIYWGNEFCQNLIPDIKNTESILDFAGQNRVEFTLVTPFVTEKGLARLKKIFFWLEHRNKNTEIVVNDWGVLEFLNIKFKACFKLSLGRLLVRQQRDPGMKKVLEKQKPFAVKTKDGKIRVIMHRIPGSCYQKGIRASYISSDLMQDFLFKFGIERVELNNIIQGLDLEGLRFKKSLYTPFVDISTTRFCPMETRHQKIYRINVCKRECQRHYDILRNRAVSKVVYKRGNTTFYKNPVAIGKLQGSGIDRIVFQPELPF